VIGDNHKGETLYRWGECCKEDFKWMGFGDKETQPEYKGQVKNGKPNGLGVIIYPRGFKYVGEYKDGKRNGQGTWTHPDGFKYVGEYKDGYRWNGIRYYKNGKIWGKYVNGEWRPQ
jgi:hypothetical protein